jgi:transcriptional regulator with XRE-family HTH domain
MLVCVEESAPIRFSKRLRELRRACRWTQEKAAEACGIGYKLYQLYELGIKQNPGLLTLEKIAEGFGLELHELLAPAPLPRPRVPKPSPSPKSKSKRQQK